MSRQRYLFLGTLLQESSANFGGRDDDENWVDAPLCLDGKGRYTLRGEGQAGALLAMARKLFKDIPAYYLGGGAARMPSVWRTYTSHPEQDDKSLAELRQCVRIDAQTGAADDGALFDLETLPRGVSWPFLLELDLSAVPEKQKQRILAITVRTLQAWADGYCWLGSGVARGLGWFRLAHPEILPLQPEAVWPNAFAASPLSYARQLARQGAVELGKFATDNGLEMIEVDGDWRWQSYAVTLDFCPPDNGAYGVSALSIGSHAVFDVSPPYPGGKHLLKPVGMSDAAYRDAWKPEQYLATTGAAMQPFIPGSALRGPLRHRLDWWLERSDVDRAVRKVCRQLFGAVDQATANPAPATAAALLICDAFLTDNNDWRMALLHSHAEDEFSGGTYGSAKYDRLALVNANFTSRFVIECREAELAELQALFKIAQNLAELGLTAIGGSTRRGFGQGLWKIEQAKVYGGSW